MVTNKSENVGEYDGVERGDIRPLPANANAAIFGGAMNSKAMNLPPALQAELNKAKRENRYVILVANADDNGGFVVNLHKSSGFSYDWMLRFLKMAEEAVLKLPPFGSDGDGEANGGADGNAKQ